MAVATPPRSPKGSFLAGNLTELRRDWLGTFTRYAREYGDFVPMRLGFRRAVLLSHPDYVEEVLVGNHRHALKSPIFNTTRRVLGNGLLLSEGDFWRRQRRLTQTAFQRQQVEAHGPAMVAATERMLSCWREGEQRDVYVEMLRLTAEIAGATLFGADVSAEAAEVTALLATATEYFHRRMGSPVLILLPDTWPLPGNFASLRAAARLDRIVYGIIEQRRRRPAEGNDLLSLLLRARDEDDSQMTDRQIRDEVMSLFLAGQEATAIALTWTWYLLAQHPEVDQKLAEELEVGLGGRSPTVADLPRLPYAGRVVAEAIRLYPPAWTVARQTVQDIEVGCRRVPAGTMCFMSEWVIQRDRRFFDHPDEFDPDRWADGLARRLPKFAYFPFGGGPRLCIGNTFALREVVLVLATIAQRFRLELVPGQTMTPMPVINLRPRKGAQVTLRRR